MYAEWEREMADAFREIHAACDRILAGCDRSIVLCDQLIEQIQRKTRDEREPAMGFV